MTKNKTCCWSSQVRTSQRRVMGQQRRLSTLLLLLCFPVFAMAQIDIVVDESADGVEISPMLYGIFYEDINHAADGGIYAELIRNRSFEDTPDRLDGWLPYFSAGGGMDMRTETEGLLNAVQKHCLHVTTSEVGSGMAGVMNSGFWGINAVRERVYTLSLWVKVVQGNGFCAMLQGADGTPYATLALDVDPNDKGWQHLTGTLTSSADDTEARFVVAAQGDADFYLDVVSLFPPTYNNHPNGLRPDLVEMLYNLHPTFMRFPGGCFVEGSDTPDNAFRWQRTIGPIEERPGHENKNWGYRTSDGLGYHEYLQLAEDLHAKPLYVCNVGIWHGGVTPVKKIQPWIDECLAAIEYANGDVTTKYGALRAKNGHPAPFNLEYIEIGNENNQDDKAQTSDHYYDRYRLFREAILAKYPTMNIIGNVAAWGTDDPRWRSDQEVDLVDEHYYRSPSWFARHFSKYDDYDRTWPKVYCGEYAVTVDFGTVGNLNAALGEAVYMMGFENNSDIVKMSSYAPIFVNENDARWMPDMVRFNNHSVMGTPSYYAQQLMSLHHGDKTVVLKEGKQTLFPITDEYTPEQSRVGVDTWRTLATFKDIAITLADGTFITASGQDTAPFDSLHESWSATAKGLSKTVRREGGRYALLTTPVVGRKYTVSLKARKEGGSEGFIIVFNYVDKNTYCWLTLGSNNNSSHVVEQAMSGGRLQLNRVPGHIEDNHWYDIRLEVDGNNIAAYLDGEEVLRDTLQGGVLPGIFASAATADDGNEMILKIVNTSGTRDTAYLNLGSFATSGGTLIQLAADSGEAENTLDAPDTVVPKASILTLNKERPSFAVPPYSFNILRLKRD